MKYRKIDPGERGKAVLKTRALQKEREAYVLECELEHLKALPSTEQTSTAVDDAQRRATFQRKLALGLTKAAKVGRADVARVRREFLDQWIESIEGQHAETATDHDHKVAALNAGDFEDEERASLEEEVAEHKRALTHYEAAHDVATRRLDALDAGSPAPPRGRSGPTKAKGRGA